MNVNLTFRLRLVESLTTCSLADLVTVLTAGIVLPAPRAAARRRRQRRIP